MLQFALPKFALIFGARSLLKDEQEPTAFFRHCNILEALLLNKFGCMCSRGSFSLSLSNFHYRSHNETLKVSRRINLDSPFQKSENPASCSFELEKRTLFLCRICRYFIGRWLSKPWSNILRTPNYWQKDEELKGKWNKIIEKKIKFPVEASKKFGQEERSWKRKGGGG